MWSLEHDKVHHDDDNSANTTRIISGATSTVFSDPSSSSTSSVIFQQTPAITAMLDQEAWKDISFSTILQEMTPITQSLPPPPPPFSSPHALSVTTNIGAAGCLHRRKIKNRESATRSRARKQAYTIELEKWVCHLRQENAELKKQRDELRLAMDAQAAKRSTLQSRSSYTAPF